MISTQKPQTPLSHTEMSGWQVIKSLLPYLWPAHETSLRVRLVAALVLLFVAKLTTSYLPILYKHAVDALSVKSPALLIVPVA